MHRILQWICLAALVGLLPASVSAAEYKLKDGKVLTGEPFGIDARGVIIRNPNQGSLAGRTEWKEFSQEALKEFAKMPKARAFVELLIEENTAPGVGDAFVEKPIPKRPPPNWSEVKGRIEVVAKPGLIGGMFTSSVGLLSLGLIYLANLYAGYAVAGYRRRPRGLVMGISAAAPVIGPAVFLALPGIVEEKPVVVAYVEPPKEEKAAPRPMPKRGGGLVISKPGKAAPAVETPPPGPVVATPAPPRPAAQLEAVSYIRGETNINKRFIETKFSGFFKLVPGPAEKNMWLAVISTRGEFWAKRIVSISATEVVLNCPQENGGSQDETIQIADIQEIHLRPQEG